MQIDDTCICGSVFRITHYDSELFCQQQHDKWLEKHLVCREKQSRYGDKIGDGWISPVQDEYQFQLEILKILFPGFPDSHFKWQYMNTLLCSAYGEKKYWQLHDKFFLKGEKS